ncbi:MAG: GTP cyclohydrolase FolE2 [bacterium]|nr:GTP cyclohydrolase FolE2 [bacterium]
MRDIQNETDKRKLKIDRVGVKDIRYPIIVMDKRKEQQSTVASINMYVNLPHHFRGTHMSRFIEVLNRHHGAVSLANLHAILEEIKRALRADSAYIEIAFPYFIEKRAPVSKSKSLMDYLCRFIASHDDRMHLMLEVNVPVTSLCPCSKSLAKQSAHNQRSMVTVRIDSKKLIWIEDIVALVEQCASAQVYALLKREDERFLTEQAYAHPAFVEDIVRSVAERLLKLAKRKQIRFFSVESENFESIHNHNAYAKIEWRRNS